MEKKITLTLTESEFTLTESELVMISNVLIAVEMNCRKAGVDPFDTIEYKTLFDKVAALRHELLKELP